MHHTGTFLIYEMKLAENLRFKRDSCQFHFVNLGDHTLHDQKNELGDHALVFMFQGNWVQALACFLSKSCAKSSVLHCLILEYLMLLEQSGFQCDIITIDGATCLSRRIKLFTTNQTHFINIAAFFS